MNLPPIDAGPPTLGLVGEDGLITAKRRTKGSCFNHALVVNEDERRVHCSKCQKQFDPIEALVFLAQKPDAYRAEYDHLVKRAEQAGKDLADLERRIKNARATLRRRGETPPPPRWGG